MSDFPNKPATLINYFDEQGFDVQIFDMSRRVYLVDNNDFAEMENQKLQFPSPFKGSAWLGFLLTANDENQPAESVWFLKLPIDELGFIKQDSRDTLIIELLQQVAKNILAKQKGEATEDELLESVFAFKPDDKKMAIMHSLVSKKLDKPASHYMKFVDVYLSGKLGFKAWQGIGLQGIADYAVRLNEDNRYEQLMTAYEQLPPEPLLYLLHAFEDVFLPTPLAEFLIGKFEELIESLVDTSQSDLEIQASSELNPESEQSHQIALARCLLRSLAQVSVNQFSASEKIPSALIEKFNRAVSMSFEKTLLRFDVEYLVILSSRVWEALCSERVMASYISAIAEHKAFDIIISDLMKLPKYRQLLLNYHASLKYDENELKTYEVFARYLNSLRQ